MSQNTHECMEHEHNQFNNSLKIVSSGEFGLMCINTKETTPKGHRILIGNNDDFNIEYQDDGYTPKKTGAYDGQKAIFGLWDNGNNDCSAYLKLYGVYPEFQMFKDTICIHNIAGASGQQLRHFDLCKWIRAVNKAVFGKDNLGDITHDFMRN